MEWLDWLVSPIPKIAGHFLASESLFEQLTAESIMDRRGELTWSLVMQGRRLPRGLVDAGC
jgi:hypothetical protein